MAIELRHLRYFVAVAEERNFTRASKRLGIGQPPLSQQIQALETELGEPLFRRMPRGAELTNAGKAFFVDAQHVLAQIESAKIRAQRAAAGLSGTLRVGCTGTAMFNSSVPKALRGFLKKYPDVSLSVEEANGITLVQRLIRDEVDIAFVRPNDSHPGQLNFLSVANEPLVIAVPDTHPLAAKKRIRLAELANEPFVMFSKFVGLTFLHTVLSACRESGFEPIVALEAPQITTLVNLVAAGLGVSLVPQPITQVKVQGVAYREIDGKVPVLKLGMATRRGDKSPIVEHFIQLIRSQLSNETASI